MTVSTAPKTAAQRNTLRWRRVVITESKTVNISFVERYPLPSLSARLNCSWSHASSFDSLPSPSTSGSSASSGIE